MKPILRLALVLLMAGMSSMVVGQDKFFDSNGVHLRYIEQGVGESVVLIHSYTSNAEGWVAAKVFQELAKNYRVIALDCRGHGKSDKPHDAKQYGQEMVLDVVRLLDHLKIQKAHIIGNSMGGGITVKLLTMKPERFLTATFGGSGGVFPFTDEELRQMDQLAAEMEGGSVRSLILNNVPRNQPKPSEEEIKQREARFAAGQDLVALAAIRRSLVDLVVTETQVATIKKPTLAIVGTADPNLEKVQKLKAVLPKLRVVTIEGATHAGAAARPEFIEAIQEFLKAHSIKKGL